VIHVLYRVLPCGYTNLMGVYRTERKHSKVNKMIALEAKQILVFPNLFTSFEQNMADTFRLL